MSIENTKSFVKFLFQHGVKTSKIISSIEDANNGEFRIMYEEGKCWLYLSNRDDQYMPFEYRHTPSRMMLLLWAEGQQMFFTADSQSFEPVIA